MSIQEKQQINDLFQQAIDGHLKGDLQAARRVYERVLVMDSSHIGALHNMGALHLAMGDNDQAIAFFQKALRLEPGYADALNNLATALKNKGLLHEALAALQSALRINPFLCGACYNLGNLHKEMGDYPKAVEAYGQAITLDPGHTDALNNLAITLMALGRFEEARRACTEALAISPRMAVAHYHMGTLWMKEGKVEEAAGSFRSALRIDPSFSDATLNLGNLMAMEGRGEESMECFHKAISANPKSPNAYYNLGLAIEKMGDLDGELSTQQAALLHCPNAPQSWIGAVRVFSKIADWRQVDPLLKKIIHYGFSESEASLLSSALFMLHACPIPDQELFEKHLLWGDYVLGTSARVFGGLSFDFSTHRREVKKLRIGYVSPDFCRHSVGWFFREIALCHDLERFEIHCYATARREDDLTGEIEGSVTSFCRVHGWDTLRLAKRIHQDRIHILVDLAGHTQGNRLDVFALRSAPIQATMIGYPNGTGLRTMDYRITDHYGETASSRSCCLERHVYLPKGFLPFYPVPPLETPIRREELGVPEGKTILVSFNRAGKLRPEVLRLWDRILSRSPQAVLLLGCGYVHRKDLRENILLFFSPENKDRVFFVPRAQTEELHRARYSLADLALDPFPYAGTTTSYEALSLHVPVITLVGDRHVQRTTYSMLKRLGVEETIAGTEEEYVDRAAALIDDPALLREIKERLSNSFHKGTETGAAEYTRSLERAYEIMWERCLKGEPAREIFV